MVRKPAIVGVGLCFLVLVGLQFAGVRDTSALKMGVGVLFWIFAWWALLPLLLRGWRHGLSKRGSPPARSPQPSAGEVRTAPPATRARCAWHHDKVVFETETEAQDFVQWTRRRHAAGRWKGKPMDHCYRCPRALAPPLARVVEAAPPLVGRSCNARMPPRAVQSAAMRRRIRSATVPLHRHSLPQVAVDGVLVALAYWLAYWLRFDGPAGVPYPYDELLDKTFIPVVLGSVAIFAAFGLYGKWWRYVTPARLQRDRAGGRRRGAGAAAVHRARQAGDARGRLRRDDRDAALERARAARLLMLTFVGGTRFAARTIYERPLRGFRASKDARGLLIVGAGDGGRLVLREILRNPELRLKPVGFVDDDPLKRRLRIDGVRVLGIDERAEPDPRRGRARRGHDRDPLGPGHAARERRALLP